MTKKQRRKKKTENVPKRLSGPLVEQQRLAFSVSHTLYTIEDLGQVMEENVNVAEWTEWTAVMEVTGACE